MRLIFKIHKNIRGLKKFTDSYKKKCSHPQAYFIFSKMFVTPIDADVKLAHLTLSVFLRLPEFLKVQNKVLPPNVSLRRVYQPL